MAPKDILYPAVWLTNRCNLRCMMCDQWKTSAQELEKELSLSQWKDFIVSVARMHPAVISITGGEPLLREDIFEIISYIRTKGISCHLCSNGSLLNPSVVRALGQSGLNSISISLDSSDPDIHNRMRGAECFSKVIKGIGLLIKITPGIKVGINCVITRLNFQGLHRLVPFVEGLGVSQIKFDPIHTNLMHRNKPLTSFEGLLFEAGDIPELESEVRKLKHVLRCSRLLTNSGMFLDGIAGAVSADHRRLPCYAGYVSCAVDAHGEVSVCDNFDGIGNLKEKTFEQIWRSEVFQEARKKVQCCAARCWDSTHAELNIRCSLRGFIRGARQILKEVDFYLG